MFFVLVSDPCAPYGLTDCADGCRQVDGSDPITVECFCLFGFYLGTDKKSCIGEFIFLTTFHFP